MSLIFLVREDYDLTGLDCYETNMHRQVGLGKF